MLELRNTLSRCMRTSRQGGNIMVLMSYRHHVREETSWSWSCQISYKKLVSLRVGSQEYFPCSSCDFSLQPVHQRCDQSLLGVVGGEDQQHGVPGQTLKTGHTAGLSGEERVTEDHSLLDTPEAPQLILNKFPDVLGLTWMLLMLLRNIWRKSLRIN